MQLLHSVAASDLARSSNVAAAADVEEAEGGHEDDSLDNREDLEQDFIEEGDFYVDSHPLPPESPAQQLPLHRRLLSKPLE